MPPDVKQQYYEQEKADKQRFNRESHEADILTMQIQEQRREKNFVMKDGESRSARKHIDMERQKKQAESDKRKRRELEKKKRRELDGDEETPEERERRISMLQKKQEVEERRQKRANEEQTLAKAHKKLDKEEAKKAAARLDYLLQQSSIFAKLSGGKGALPQAGEKDEPSAAASITRKKNSQVHHRGNGAEDRAPDGDVKGDEEDFVEEEVEKHVFLTQQPSVIKFGKLKPYQIEALNWMIHLAEKGLNGILADEMGLGKTVQSISIMAYHYEFLNIQGPHLICVPKSTLSNWMNELARWCPSLRAIKFHGPREDREYMIDTCFTNEAAAHDGKRPTHKPQIMSGTGSNELIDDNSENPRPWDVCVTTYEVANTEQRVLRKFAWKYLIIDEAHRLKNDASMFSKTVRSFKTANRLLLTG
jgi:SWI/SNF-related matrix-associated actin-dependent regulator of chromatin subfamily A member 5